MKSNMIKQILGVATLSLAAVFAQAETKIAIVDMQRAVLASDAAQEAIEIFKKEKQSDIDTLAGLEKDLKGMQDNLKKNADTEYWDHYSRYIISNATHTRAHTHFSSVGQNAHPGRARCSPHWKNECGPCRYMKMKKDVAAYNQAHGRKV